MLLYDQPVSRKKAAKNRKCKPWNNIEHLTIDSTLYVLNNFTHQNHIFRLALLQAIFKTQICPRLQIHYAKC